MSAKLELVYSFHPNGGIVVATRKEAVRVDMIYRALSNAETWGEFRFMLPHGEWPIVVSMLKESYEDQFEDEGEIPIWEFVRQPFNSDDIPGVSEGEYPAWLQQTMNRIIPKDILQWFGSEKSSTLSGQYWHIDPDLEDELIEALNQRGYDITHDKDLTFY